MTAFEILQKKALANCKKTAQKMAKIELSIIDNKEHQKELKQYFRFTDKKIRNRKNELQNAAI